MKLIPRYDGTGGIQKLLEFIDNFEIFCTNADLSTNSELILATAKLTGNAKMWWHEHQNITPINSTHRIRNWHSLRTNLMEQFAPPENSDAIRAKLRKITQTGSIAEYNAAFRQLTIQLTDLNFAEAKFEYLRGLNTHIRDLVRTQKENLTDIRTLQLACLRLDTHREPTTKSTRNDEALLTSGTRTTPIEDVAVAEDVVVILVHPRLAI